jgi:hypothetical protein
MDDQNPYSFFTCFLAGIDAYRNLAAKDEVFMLSAPLRFMIGTSPKDIKYDEVWLYAMNTDTTARKLTIEWGGVSAPDDLIEITIPAETGLTLVAPGLVLRGNASPLVVRAFAATTNVVTIHGFVNRIS